MDTLFTFSGHETFALRITWLPKAVSAVELGEDPFSDPRKGMVMLGLGKNMVQSLQFWVVATGLVKKNEGTLCLTELAKQSLSRKSGKDPFLENTQTLWLLHWNLCRGWGEEKTRHRASFAWYYFSSLHAHGEISPSEALEIFDRESDRGGKKHSAVTLKQHLDIFLKTYVHSHSPAARATPEDALDSPLTSLSLIRPSGNRRLPSGKREILYQVNQSACKTLKPETFRYCLHHWWSKNKSSESTATLREVALSGQSPGRCFRMPETSVYEMVKLVVNQFPEEFELHDSQSQRVLTRKKSIGEKALLETIYR